VAGCKFVAQPFLHELVTCVRAPTCVLSPADGQIRADGGAEGLFRDDVRHLAELIVRVDGREPVPVASRLLDHGRAAFVAALQGVGDPIADPTVRLERSRRATADGMIESLTVVNDSRSLIEPIVTVRVAVDMAPIPVVKRGAATSLVAPDAGGRWSAHGRVTELSAESTDADAVTTTVDDGVTVRWVPRIPSRASATLSLTIAAGDPASTGSFAAAPSTWARRVEVGSRHPALAPLVARSLDDLETLLLVDGAGDRFAAAGVPWFLTLFGRDSLWAARFALPVDVGLAAGTLRTLARRQATAVDVTTAAEPGKILHEVRAAPSSTDAEHALPPLYYGTVDATPLWISLLCDAWRWGLPDAEVAELLDALGAAIGWLVGHDGFLTYEDASGRGLANQGWKDSGDSIQDAAGRIATPPITLCEVQGYAYRAALDGARLLDAFDRPGAAASRTFAADVQARFRSAFWTSGQPHGRFPAVALDRDGRPVDSLTSNIGHLPATGLLDADEIAIVAGHLGRPSLDSGYGLRTLADDHPMFNPLGYHSGSVWPHDTAITIDGLAATGHGDVAATLAGGLLAAAPHFGFRLPELFGGWPAVSGPPLDYPAACRPQAWAAACPLVILRAALGLDVDIPTGRIAVRPDSAFTSLFPLTVTGLRVGPHRLDVAVDEAGRATVETDAPFDVQVR
jgi:glycogen debranching enzyme